MKITFATKIALAAALMSLAALSLFAYFSFRQHTALLVAAIQEELAATVRNAAAVFDAEDIAEASPAAVARLREQLDTLAELNPYDRDFRVFRAAEDDMTLLAVSPGGPPTEPAALRRHNARLEEAIFECRRDLRTCVTPLYGDEAGQWVTAFTPVFDAAGQVAGVLAADREAVEYREAVRLTLRQMALYSVVALVAAGLLGVFVSVRMTRPLRRLYEAAVAARGGKFEPVRAVGKDEIAALTRSFNETNAALQSQIDALARLNAELEEHVETRTEELKASLAEVRRRQGVIQREMNTARRVQETIIPRSLHRERIDIEVEYVPILEIGGDMGLVIERGGGGYEIVVGDVTGHGIGAALVVNRVHTLLTGLYAVQAPLDSVFHRLDYFLSREIADIGMFLTLMAFRIDVDAMTAQYAGGGHVAALLRSGATGEISDIESRCGILGAGDLFCEGSPVGELALDHGDCLLLYTDGLVEAVDEEGKAFGHERLVRTFAAAAGAGGAAGGENIASRVLAAAKDYTGGRFQDDVLVLAALIK